MTLGGVQCAWASVSSALPFPINVNHRCTRDSDAAFDITMKTSGCILLLVAFLALWELGQNAKVKPGVCPNIEIGCLSPPPRECKDDSKCPGDQKCCPICETGRRCLTPQVKPGVCPNVEIGCVSPPLRECQDDSKCPGDQKCCPICETGRKCLTPQVKAGNCPKIKTICKMENPPVYCSSDFNCPGDQKCCELFCSTDCTNPGTTRG